MTILVSVVIPAHNEEKNLPYLLESINKQTYLSIETIVIDDSSTDKTAIIAKEHGATVYTRPRRERSIQRNFGAKVAKGKYLLFLDADMELSSDVVKSCVLLAEKNGWDALIIPEKSFGDNYWAKAKALERNCYIGDPDIEAARFIKHSVFNQIGGYDPDMISGEDWDLHKRLLKHGYKVGRTNEFIIHHEGKLSYLKVLKKKLYYSQKSDQYIKNNVTNIKDIIRFVTRPSIIKNWRLLLADPIHIPGLIFLVWGEMLVGGFGAIIFKPVLFKKIFHS